jgi:prepilin-type N-terminal cleavage/methylation domain-containing protein
MREKGFSLLELLIVVAIILVIAAIVIPSLLRSRQQIVVRAVEHADLQLASIAIETGSTSRM